MKKFLFNGYALYQGKIIYKEFESGLLCELDTNTGVARYIEDLKNYKIVKTSFDCMLEHKGKLYAIENNANSMMEYNGTDGICKWISMNCGARQWGNFTNLFAFEQMLFFFHREENWITCYDLETECIEKIECEKIGANICSCRIEDKVWIFPRTGNRIQVFDLKTKTSIYHKIEQALENIVGCMYDNNNIYLLQDNGLLYVLKPSDLSIEKITLAVDDSENNLMGKCICVTDKIILLPSAGNDIKIVDLDKKVVDIYSSYPEDFVYDDIMWSKFYTICEDDDYYYLLRKSNYLLKIRKKDAHFIWIKLGLSNENIKEKLFFRYKYVKDVMQESDININTLIENIVLAQEKNFDAITFVGTEIWRKI